MANINETLIPIPGRLHSVATEGHVAGADEIIDDTLQKDQATLNSESAYIDNSESSPAVVPDFDPASQSLHIIPQVLSEQQKAQARTNIDLNDLVKYSGQTLTTAQKDQVAANLNNKNATNGMARIELKATDNFKSIVEAQTGGNTIFVIKYDFTLTGDVTIPANCVLDFDGGSLSGAYTITGNNTGIKAGLVKIFNTNVALAGSWNVAEAYPEWFGSFPENTLAAASSEYRYTDVSVSLSKLFEVFDVVFLHAGYYGTSQSFRCKNLKGLGGKFSSIVGNATENGYTPLVIGKDGYDADQRLWNATIDGVSIYLTSANNTLKETSCIEVRSVTRLVIKNVTFWNYVARQSEFTDSELDNVPVNCNYGIVFNGDSELITLKDYTIAGDIGVYFKYKADNVSFISGYIQCPNTNGYGGIYGNLPSAFSIDGHLSIAGGLCGINGELNSAATLVTISNMRLEQLRNTSFQNHKNYLLDFKGTGEVCLNSCFLPTNLNLIHNTCEVNLNKCFGYAPGSTYLGTEVMSENILRFTDCKIDTNGRLEKNNQVVKGLKSPFARYNGYTGLTFDNGVICPKNYSFGQDAVRYNYNGNGVFYVEFEGYINSGYNNLWYLPQLFMDKVSFVKLELMVCDSEYYQEASWIYKVEKENSNYKLTYHKELYNFGDDVFGKDGSTSPITVGTSLAGTIGFLNCLNSIGKNIYTFAKFSCIALEWDGNRNT